MVELTYTIEGAVAAIGLPRTTVYQLLGAGKLDGRKAGRRTLITGVSIRTYLDNLPPAKIKLPKEPSRSEPQRPLNRPVINNS